MTDRRTRIVTPYTDPDRFTPEEKAAFDAGRCSRDLGGDWGRTDTLCRQPSKPGASFGYCVTCEREFLADHWPDGSPRR